MKYLDLLKECSFNEPYDTCLNIRTKNFDYTLCFISFETEDKLGILETTESGREKLKIINKNCIEVIEIVYADDIDFEKEEKTEDRMFR